MFVLGDAVCESSLSLSLAVCVFVGWFAVVSVRLRVYVVTLTFVTATFMVFEDFQNYSGGVYRHEYGDFQGLHSVKVRTLVFPTLVLLLLDVSTFAPQTARWLSL